jgi:hypothetical protein
MMAKFVLVNIKGIADIPHTISALKRRGTK